MKAQLVLGDFVFSVSNETQYNKLSRSSGSGWKKQSRMGQKAKKHLSEVPLDRITLSGDWYGENGEAALAQLRAMRFEPHLLSDSSGFNKGTWTIENIDESQTYIQQDGLAEVLSFTIQLEETSLE